MAPHRKRQRLPHCERLFILETLPLAGIAAALRACGAMSMRLMTPQSLRCMGEESMTYSYREAREHIGSGAKLVRQRMGIRAELPVDSIFYRLASEFQQLMDRSLASLDVPIFDERPVFNDIMLQRYDVGDFGITPHMDRTAYRYIICLFVIAGRGRFGICEDRDGTHATDIQNEAGDVIFMRGPGFDGSSARPFHYLGEISEARYVFGLRHDASKGLEPAQI